MTWFVLRYSPVLAVFLAVSRIVIAAAKPVDSLSVLQLALNEPGVTRLSVLKTPAGREIHYCPDNTCVVFKAANSVPESVLADFAFTYIFYASGYTYVRDFVTKTGQPHSRLILGRNSSGCTRDAELDLASCVLRSLAQRYSIRVFEARYDEGARTDVPVDVKSAVAADELKRVKAWQLEQWRSHP